MSLIPIVAPEPAPRRRLRAADLSAEIQRVCPELPVETPEHRAGVLLGMLSDTGPNVDRLVLRTGYAREFVARCLRRLSDNAWWVEGSPQPSWGAEGAASRDFWLDVEVALGRMLRRIGAGGEPEWAPAVGGGWVKAFEYRGPHSGGDSLHNQYREIEAYDPEPVLPSEVEEEAEEEESRAARVSNAPAARERPVAIPLPAAAPGQWLGQPASPRAGEPPTESVSAGFLVGDWKQANWLQ